TQLGSFAAEVTRVAREVGTEGKLGGQAKVKGVAGTWKDLTDNVNLMAGNLTGQDRKSTRLNSSHSQISYAVFCLKKKEGSYPVSINVTLYDGNSQHPLTLSSHFDAGVADADLQPLQASLTAVANETTGTVTVATSCDADPLVGAADFTEVAVSGGDGSPVGSGQVVELADGTFAVQAGHTYTAAGNYPLCFFIKAAPADFYTLSLHDALPI